MNNVNSISQMNSVVCEHSSLMGHEAKKETKQTYQRPVVPTSSPATISHYDDDEAFEVDDMHHKLKLPMHIAG